MERDIRYSTLQKVEEYIRQNQPIWVSELSTKAKIDFNSAKNALKILNMEGKIEYLGNKINKQIKLKDASSNA